MKGSKRRTKAFSLGHTIIFQLHEMVYILLQYHGERIQVYITPVVGVSHSQRWQFSWNSLFIDSRGMLTGDQCGVMDDPNVDKGRCWNDLTDTMMMMVMTKMVQIMMITILDGDFIRE